MTLQAKTEDTSTPGDLEIKELSGCSDDTVASLMSEAFADYLAGPVHMDLTVFRSFCAAGAVEPALSFIAWESGKAVGVVLVGRRGAFWRVATMGIVPAHRRRGLGRRLLNKVLERAREQGCLELQLEVFEQNSGALSLYRELGFSLQRSLHGWRPAEPPGVMAAPNIFELGEAQQAPDFCGRLDYPQLPWQNSPFGASLLIPAPAYLQAAGVAVAVCSLETDTPVLRSVFTDSTRCVGAFTCLLQALRSAYPKKQWRVPALWPEEFAPAFEQAGFLRSPLHQLQMKLVPGDFGSALQRAQG